MIEDLSAVAGLAVGQAEQTGRFWYQVADDTWWWSGTMFRIHGFEPGEVLPTTELLMAHKHPDDRAYTQEVIAHVLETGEPFSCYHRIIDAQSRVRCVVGVGDATVDGDGTVTELRGYLVDLTESRRRDTAEDANAAVKGALVNRAVIEQAKGALMFVYAIDADTAFSIMSSASQNANLKVHDLARRFMAATESVPAELPRARARLIGLLDAAAGQPGSIRDDQLPA